jgi:metallo-beta-lactamase superfamily protein
VLIDSGPDHVRGDAAMLRIDGDSPALLTAGLRAAGLEAADVGLIVHTHLHYDHMQNDLLFPNAPVVVRRTELDWATSPDSGPFYVDVSELTGALGDRLRLLDGETDILPGLSAAERRAHPRAAVGAGADRFRRYLRVRRHRVARGEPDGHRRGMPGQAGHRAISGPRPRGRLADAAQPRPAAAPARQVPARRERRARVTMTGLGDPAITADLLITGADLVTMDAARPLVRDGAIAVRAGQISWIGTASEARQRVHAAPQ